MLVWVSTTWCGPFYVNLERYMTVAMEELLDRIRNDFRHHTPPSEGEGQKLTEVRIAHSALAVALAGSCPPGRELSLALTKLEESMFWANASIARTWV